MLVTDVAHVFADRPEIGFGSGRIGFTGQVVSKVVAVGPRIIGEAGADL